MRTKSYRDLLLNDLKDPDFAADYLAEVLKNETQETFLIAVKNVMDARKLNKSKLSRKVGLTRQSLYHALSKKGNPRLSTLNKLLNSIGFEISIVSKQKQKRVA